MAVFRLSKILVATDFSENAAAALGRAVQLAERAGAEVIVVHVLGDPAWAVPSGSFNFEWTISAAEIEQAERKLRREAEERLAQLLAPHRATLSRLRSEVCVGVPFVEIIRTALREGADLVMTGTRGLSTIPRLLVGSTAERLVRKCPCPVWIVKPQHEWPLQSLLVPIDFTPVSRLCLQLAATLTDLCSCSVNVLHVVNFPALGGGGTNPEPETRPSTQRRRLRQAAAHHLNQLVAEHFATPAAVGQHLAVGYPWQVIDRTAKRLRAGLIVMGSVGRTGIPGFFIGNTAEKVLRRCDRSLLTVKPEGFVSPVQ